MHISQMVDKASEAVVNVQVVQGHCLMDLMKDDGFTQEQKVRLIELFKPVESVVTEAKKAFIFNSS